MPSETSAVNAAYIEARMKQFKLVDMREQYQELIRVASEQSMTYAVPRLYRSRPGTSFGALSLPVRHFWL